jgi:DNA mismatch repair protein MutS2
MLQCGLLIPVSPDSLAGVFQDIFIDIGDQQSIENDLSTYSSHLKNLGFFLQHASDKSLVLLDELGAGTDPNFGGPIAQAILQGLVMKNVWGVATTHYYNLKLFAGQTRGIRNAAMRFDERNLTPLYILDIGKPGSSFALEIAQKTGLPTHTLEEAQRLIGKELMGVEVLIQNLEREKTELTEKVKAFEKQDAQLKSLVARYDKLSADLEMRKKEIIEKSKLEANALLRDTNKQIEKTIRHIRENQAERKETSKVRKNLQELSKKVTSQPAQTKEQAVAIKVGDRVRIIGQDGSGIVESIQGKNAVVQLGELKSMIALTKLEKTSTSQLKQEVSKKLQSIGIKLYEKQSHFNPTLDIRGKRVDEVVPLLDQFIDTAILLSQGEVRILHGKGEGVLRKVVRDHLKRYKQVASVSDEHVERGGDGISIVVLK